MADIPFSTYCESPCLKTVTFCDLQNPETANPPNAGLGRSQKADYPEDKKKEFEGTPGGYSWISAKDTSLLDFEGCELVFISAKADINGAPPDILLVLPTHSVCKKRFLICRMYLQELLPRS